MILYQIHCFPLEGQNLSTT
uniref:Uncharacterized protein n=1 Tax=Anguilla anguilla TaxID=7936 RepID=A0A0E9SET6_ANGAN